MASREGRLLSWRRLLSTTVFILLLFVTPTIHAVEYGNIGGKPARPDPNNSRTQSIFIKYAAPGETVSDVVKLVNYTGETKTLQVYAVDSIVSSGGSFGCAQFVDEKKGVGSWVKMSKDEVTLEPNNEEEVPFTVTPGANADVGENDGCIVIQEKDAAPQSVQGENSSINLSFRTAIRLAVFLPGEVKKSVQILAYAASKGNNGEYILKPRVKNNGNVSLDVTLNTYTRPLLGFKTDNYNQESPLLRGVTSDWNIPFKPWFLGGFYTSRFTITYDSNVSNSLGDSANQNLVTQESASIIFFVFPSLWGLLLLLVILLVIAFILWRLYLLFVAKKRRTRNWKTIVINSPTDIETVARAYGISWKELAKANRMHPPYLLRQGDQLRVPSGQQAPSQRQGVLMSKLSRKKQNINWQIITISQPVDIETVARNYQISWKQLAKQNNLKPPYILRQGDHIKVPQIATQRPVPQHPQQGFPQGGQRQPMMHPPAHVPHDRPGLLSRIPYFERKRMAREWEEITLNPHIDSIVSTPLDIEAIAKNYGVPWKTLAKINKLKPPYRLKPGDRLKVPYKNKNFPR